MTDGSKAVETADPLGASGASLGCHAVYIVVFRTFLVSPPVAILAQANLSFNQPIQLSGGALCSESSAEISTLAVVGRFRFALCTGWIA